MSNGEESVMSDDKTALPAKPARTVADAGHALVKGILGAVPIAGSTAAEVFALIVAPPIEKRRDEWFDQVAAAVEELRGRVANLTPESLSKNDVFVTTLLHATQVASRTHEKEKLQALKNAVINAGLPEAPNETLQHIFLSYVDELTPWHLRLLAYFDDPSAWFRAHNLRFQEWSSGSPSQALETAIPELAGQRSFYDVIVAGLNQRGLLNGNIHGMVTGPGMIAQRTTPLGRQFISFVSQR
jgi:hypothetical protein